MAQLDGANYFMCDLEFKKVGLFVLVVQVILFVIELKKSKKKTDKFPHLFPVEVFECLLIKRCAKVMERASHEAFHSLWIEIFFLELQSRSRREFI